MSWILERAISRKGRILRSLSELRRISQIGLVEILVDDERKDWTKLLLPGSSWRADAGLGISIVETRSRRRAIGQRFGNIIIREGGLTMPAFRGRSIDITYDAETLDSASSVCVEYEAGFPGGWLVEHILEPLAFVLNLNRGVLFAHAAALTLSGRSMLLFGWTRVGKTQILLHALRKGAKLMSDDWIGISADGLIGYPRAIKLSEANLSSYPGFASRSFALGDCRFVSPLQSETSTEKIMTPDHVITLLRYEGTGLTSTGIPIETTITRIPSTLSYMLTHYVGLLVAASQYRPVGKRKELGSLVHEVAPRVLGTAFHNTKARELRCGYESEEELLSFSISLLGEDD